MFNGIFCTSDSKKNKTIALLNKNIYNKQELLWIKNKN